MVRQLRFHGRGGEGVKLSSRIVSRAGFLAGAAVQDSPLYGAERRGAPVVAFARLGSGPIQERGYILQPDAVVLLDASLLQVPEAGVLEGVAPSTVILVNSPLTAKKLVRAHHIQAQVLTLDVSSIALEVLGQHVLSAPMAGWTVHTLGLARWQVLRDALRIELAETVTDEGEMDRNLEATERAFAAAEPLRLRERREAPVEEAPPFRIPHLPARLVAPSIESEGNSELRHTDGWRVYRPVIELERCSRCFLCFCLCPEGAIHLNGQDRPFVDYDHCKGCLVCAHECPTEAIREERETA